MSGYFDGVRFHITDHHENCPYRMDTAFPFYAINLIRSGSFVFSAGSLEPEPQVDLPLVLITAPGRRFRYAPGESGSWEHYFITFSGPRVDKWLESGLLPDLNEERYWLQTFADDPEMVDRFLRGIHAVQRIPSGYDLAVHELEGLLLYLKDAAQQKIEDPHRAIIRRHIAAIRAKPEVDWDLQALAEEAEYSISHYRRLFSETATCSPSQHIRRQRMLKASHLLCVTREPIKVIAAVCGYDDVFHFSKQFKLEHGVSPGTFRKR